MEKKTPPLGNFIVGSITDGIYSFALKPKRHDTEASAKTEAERLAHQTPGKTFVVMEEMAAVQASAAYTWSV